MTGANLYFVNIRENNSYFDEIIFVKKKRYAILYAGNDVKIGKLGQLSSDGKPEIAIIGMKHSRRLRLARG